MSNNTLTFASSLVSTEAMPFSPRLEKENIVFQPFPALGTEDQKLGPNLSVIEESDESDDEPPSFGMSSSISLTPEQFGSMLRSHSIPIPYRESSIYTTSSTASTNNLRTLQTVGPFVPPKNTLFVRVKNRLWPFLGIDTRIYNDRIIPTIVVTPPRNDRNWDSYNDKPLWHIPPGFDIVPKFRKRKNVSRYYAKMDKYALRDEERRIRELRALPRKTGYPSPPSVQVTKKLWRVQSTIAKRGGRVVRRAVQISKGLGWTVFGLVQEVKMIVMGDRYYDEW